MAICDGPVALNASAMQKVEDALQWLYKAKNDARKALQACAGTGQGVQALKSALSSKVQEVLRFQLTLEEVKISGQGEFQETKALLSNTAKALMDTQELVRGLTAMS